MLTDLLRRGMVLTGACTLVIAGGATVRAEIAPTPVTPLTEVPATQPEPSSSEWVTVPLSLAPTAADPGSGGDHPNATAKSLRVSPLGVCVSCTSAGSRRDAPHSGVTALSVLGMEIAGGDSTGTGRRSGALVMVPANPLLGLAIASWMADTRADGSAHSRASLIDITLGPKSHGRRAGTGDDQGEGAVTLSVVESDSDSTVEPSADKDKGDASSGDMQKTGREWKHAGKADTNAVQAGSNDQALALALAHSDSSSDGQGTAYVAGVNKGQLVSSHQTGEGIPVEVPGVTKVVVVENTATDGSAAASVANVDAPPADTASTPPTGEVASTASAVSIVSGGTPVTAPSTGAAAETSTPAIGSGGASGIPSTGAATSLAGAGAMLLILGAGILAFSSRRRPAPAT